MENFGRKILKKRMILYNKKLIKRVQNKKLNKNHLELNQLCLRNKFHSMQQKNIFFTILKMMKSYINKLHKQ